MSSTAFLTFDNGEEIPLADWQKLASEYHLQHRPEVVGGNTYQVGEVQVRFGDNPIADNLPADQITFSTYFMGAGLRHVAALTVAAWKRFGGSLDAAPEIRNLIGVVG
jgi:hypothetical protein